MLKTGWTNWDKFLQPIADLKGPIKILEVGAYEGSATKWMLKYLATNPESRVYAIDTWEGSPEYVGTDFHEVEDTFRRRVKDTGREDQLVTLKMKSEDGLHHLLDSIGKETIHFAYIDASHEARDVLSDAILVWKLIKEDGIVIFDDYRWNDLEQEYFRPRLAIDSFIQSYAPELRVLTIDRQVFLQKLNRSKWITPTLNYKDWSVVMKKLNTLNDAILNIPQIFVEPISKNTTRRSPRTSSFAELSFSTTPSFSPEDKIEYTLKKILPGKEKVLFERFITPNQPSNSILGTNIKVHAIKEHSVNTSFLKPTAITTYRKYESDKTAWLEMIVSESDVDTQIINYATTFELSKEFMMPTLKKYDLVYIQKPDTRKKYSNAPFIKLETLASLETQTYLSLKSNTYDVIEMPLMTDATFSFEDYTKINCHGRDSLSIKWNSLYILMATHCLKKGGSLHCLIFGDRSSIVCEFISYISSLFSKTPSLNNSLNTATYANHTIFRFQGYKGITKEQQTTLLQWYHSLKADTYYSSLGVPCKPIIQSLLQKVSEKYVLQFKKVAEIARQYKELLDMLTPTKRETIQKYLIGLRVNNYFTSIAKYIKEIPL
jgi:predicted O-methyltransferase YrrM